MTHVITTNMYEQILTGAISGLIGFLGAYVLLKKTFNEEKILDYLDMTLDELTQNVEMQKKVYIMGVLLGNGIKQGLGLKGGRGKFKMEDLIGMGMQWFFGKMDKQEGQPPLQPIEGGGDSPFKPLG